ncbi:MAG: hypothetical protein ACFNUK_09645, partial [Schaalia sp.]
MEEIRLGPIEWGVVTAHNPWGLDVRLEESGDEEGQLGVRAGRRPPVRARISPGGRHDVVPQGGDLPLDRVPRL